MSRKNIIKIGLIILILVLVVFGIRIFSNEDDWICENGQWIQHGHPSSQAPIDTCFANGEFGGVPLRIEYALTEEAREKGLGGQKDIPDDYGMLFVFPKEERYGFWMNDMLVPTDVFWLDSKGQVVSISKNVATSTYPDVFYPIEPTKYVLETAAGFAQEHGIATGTQLLLKNLPIVSK